MEVLLYAGCLLILMVGGMLSVLFKRQRSWWGKINAFGIAVLINLAVLSIIGLIDAFLPEPVQNMLNTPILWLMGAVPVWCYAYWLRRQAPAGVER